MLCFVLKSLSPVLEITNIAFVRHDTLEMKGPNQAIWQME